MATDTCDDIGDDDLVPLAKACKIFLHGHLTKSSLRREHSRGNLEIIRIANKDFVTRNIIRRMIERCTVRTDEGDGKTEATRSMDRPSGGSAHEALKMMLAREKQARTAGVVAGSPRAAAKARLKQLRDSLPATNPQTSRRATRKKGDEQ